MSEFNDAYEFVSQLIEAYDSFDGDVDCFLSEWANLLIAD